MFIFLRKFRSAFLRFFFYSSSWARRFWFILFQSGVSFGRGVQISRGVIFLCTDGGCIELGDRVSIGVGAQLICKAGRMVIGSDVFIGPGCIISCQEAISIGRDSQIAEYCVIRDQDHSFDSRPIRLSGFSTAPIFIGEDCWLGAKVTVLRGSVIGDGAVLGAHSLVKGLVDPYTLAVGCPTRTIRRLEKKD